MNSEIVKKDYIMLDQIINTLETLDPDINDILNYTQTIAVKNSDGDSAPKIISALGIAHHEGNNKAVELLLKFLSKRKGESNIINYQHLFP